MTNAVNTRELVLGILMLVTKQEEYSHQAIRGVLNKYNYLDKKDRAFIKCLSEGTIERMLELDYMIDQVSSTPVSKMKPVIRNIIRMSVYQMKYMSSVPSSAICNEAVKLAGKKGFSGLKGFVNGVLRNMDRKQEAIVWPDKSRSDEYLSVKYSMPIWLVQKWSDIYGTEVTEKILDGLIQKRPVSIRCNTSKIPAEQLIKVLTEQGVSVKQSVLLPYALEIDGFDNLAGLDSFMSGLFMIQDISSMLVAEIANPQKGMVVLDVCSAPGGKVLHIADKMCEEGTFYARDISSYKIGMIEENMQRSGMRCIQTNVWDALKLDEEMIGRADIVIADLPCSGLGVIGRKADIKYRVTQQTIIEIAALQKQILSVIQNYVKPGGVLIYSTCTVSKEENEEMLQFLTEQLPLRMDNIEPYLPKQLACETAQSGYLQLLPGIHPTDGFFIARLIKD